MAANVHETIKIKGTKVNSDTSATFQLASYDAHHSHLNINIVSTKHTGDTDVLYLTIDPDEAVAIRDVLLSTYPLDEFPIKEKTVRVTIEVPVNNKSLLIQALKALNAEEVE